VQNHNIGKILFSRGETGRNPVEDGMLTQNTLNLRLKKIARTHQVTAPALWNGLPKDHHQIAYPPNKPLNFASPPLALFSATFTTEDRTLSSSYLLSTMHANQ